MNEMTTSGQIVLIVMLSMFTGAMIYAGIVIHQMSSFPKDKKKQCKNLN
jgi:hypothetical protein